MDERRKQSVHELKRQLEVLEETLSEEEKMLQARNKNACSLSTSIAEVENSIYDCEEELKHSQVELEDALRSNRIMHSEDLHPKKDVTNYLEREAYIKEISELDDKLKETENHVSNFEEQVKTLSDTPEDPNTVKRLALVNLIAMLDDLHESLSRSVQSVPPDEDIRAGELMKAIRELSRERERTLSYCLRKKRELSSLIELKKQKTNELMLESQKNISIVCDDQDRRVLHVVEKIQTERRLLEDEVSKIEATNEQLWESLREAKYPSVNGKNGELRREAALSVNNMPPKSVDAEKEREQLKEQLEQFKIQKQKLQRMTEDLKKSMDTDKENHARQLKDLRREILSQQSEGHRIEDENKKLKSLCDSLAEALKLK